MRRPLREIQCSSHPGVYISLSWDRRTNSYQLSIDHRAADGSGYGHRLAGAKFSGNSILLQERRLDKQTADQIRSYLDLVQEEISEGEHA